MRAAFGLLFLAAVAVGYAQVGTAPETGLDVPPAKEFGDRWTRAGWSRKDPFEDDRKRFEAAPPSRQKLEEETERWLAKPPGNPREAYRFGTVARLLSIDSEREGHRRIGFLQMIGTIRAAVRAMAKNPADNSAEFARMRFLLEVRYWSQPELIPLARRLVERFPERPGLRLRLADLLQFTDRAENLREALTISRDLARDHPDSADVQLQLAIILSSAGLVLKDRRLLEEAIEQHERCLRMPEMSATRKQMVRANLETLRKRLRKLEG